MLKILVAVDGSPSSMRALDAIAQWVRHGAAVEVVVLNVRDDPVIHGEAVESLAVLEAVMRRQQDDILRRAEAHASECGVAVSEVRRAEGHPSAEILRVAAEVGAAQIAMGTHGRGALGVLLLGSVAQRVLHSATVPVLLAR